MARVLVHATPGSRWDHESGPSNLGDTAQTEATADFFRELGYEVTLVLSGDDDIAKLDGIDTVGDWFVFDRGRPFATLRYLTHLARLAIRGRWHRFKARRSVFGESGCAALADAELFVFSGGGVLTDRYLGSIVRWLLITLTVRLAGIPVIATGQGVGPLNRKDSRAIVRLLLYCWRSIGVRDASSLALSKQLASWALCKRTTRVYFSADDTVRHPDVRACWSQFAPPEIGNSPRYLAVNLRSGAFTGLLNSDRDWVLGVARSLADQLNCTAVRFVSLQNPPTALEAAGSSDAPAWAIQGLAATTEFNIEVVVARDVRTVVQSFRGCVVALGTPYHFNAFAAWSGVPTVALAGTRYMSQKLEGLRSFLGDAVTVVRTPSAAGSETFTPPVLLHLVEPASVDIDGLIRRSANADCNVIRAASEAVGGNRSPRL